MKALILVGGFGTRLRPLTLNLPKPLVKFCGRPMVEWQIESLVKIGVDKIVLAIGYKEQLMREFMARMKKKYKIEIVCSVEKVPLNTGGPLKLAQKHLLTNEDSLKNFKKSKENLFFVLNSDIVCNYPLQEMIDQHLNHKGEATILVTKVSNPQRFGIVVHDDKSKLVSRFVEKSKEYVGNYINAGMYIFDVTVLNKIELKNVSLERKIFPELAEQGLMYVKRLDGYWKDIGIPTDFLKATELKLIFFHSQKTQKIDEFEIVSEKDNIIGENMIHKTAKIHPEAIIGPYCVIHANVKINKGARIYHSVIMRNTTIGASSHVFDSILMHNIKIADFCRIDHHSILAEKVNVEEGLLVNHAKINPSEQINEFYFDN